MQLLPGLTSIVGPNGCGKSNIVEAFRWIMGESSARALRGGDSDDLIFAGTVARPARNLVEVSLKIEAATGLAAAPHDAEDVLEILRMAKRGGGSEFRINGKPARAHDVSQIFADLSLGGRSLTIVSQNRIGRLIESKPVDRRSLLENAAGISGLHFRRRDAELKLRQAEANLQRAADGLQLVIERRDALELQSAAAITYRGAVETIRQLEATLYAMQHARAKTQIAESDAQIRHETDVALKAEMQLRSLREAQAAEEENTTRLAAENETSRNEIEACRINIERARHKAAQTLAIQWRLSEQEAHVQAERERLVLRLEQLEQEAAAHAQTLMTLETRLRDAPEQVAWLSAEHQAASHHDDLALQACETAERAWHEARANADSLQHQRKTTEQLCASSKIALTACRARLAAAQAALPDPLTIQTLIEKGHEARAERENLEKEKTSRAGALQIATNQCESDTREQEFLTQKIAAMTSDAVRAEARRTTLEKQVRDLQQRLETSEAALRTDAFFTEQESDLARAKDAEAALEQEEGRHRAQLAQANEARIAVQSARATQLQQRQFLEQQAEATVTRLDALTARIAEESSKAANAEKNRSLDAALSEASSLLQDAISALDQHHADASRYEKAAVAQKDRLEKEESKVLQLESACIRLEAERRGLADLLEVSNRDNSLLERLDVIEKLIPAIGAALRDGIDAQIDTMRAVRSWITLPPKESGAFPADVQALSTMIHAPAALRSFLDATGLVATAAQGDALQASLKPGQTLVTQDGALWRWDGFRQAAGQPSDASQRIQAKAREAAKARELAILQRDYDAAVNERDALRMTYQQSIDQLKAVTAAQEVARATRDEKQQQYAHLKAEKQQFDAALNAASERLADLKNQAAELLEQSRTTQDALSRLPTLQSLDAQVMLAAQRHEALSATQAQSETSLQAARGTRKRLEHALLQIRAADDAARVRIKDLTENLQHCFVELQAQSAQEIARVLPHTIERLETLKKESLAHLEHLKASRSAHEEAEQRVTSCAKSVVASEAQLRTLQDTHLTQSAAISSLTEQLTTLVQSDAAAEAQLAQLPPAPDLSDVATTLAASRKDALATRERRDAARAEKAALELRFRDDSTAHEAEQKQGALLSKQIDACREDLSRIDARSAEINAARSQLELESGASDVPLASLEAQLNETIARYDSLKNSLLSSRAARAACVDAVMAQDAARKDALSRLERAKQMLEDATRLQERLQETPPPSQTVPPPTDISERAEQALRRALNSATQKRDQLGAVNLLAEEEFEAARAQIEEAQRNVDEIQTAITRLQAKIAELNQEGRKRLKATFQEVDQQFQKLFAHVFGGGKANLALVGGDDPLEAGLEIYAQPPGKKLSTLSLLSGGEQALTALSLLFATFTCQPAPICILDEVDAPLDEANTVRLCTLVRDITTQFGVQFLIVTHQQMTMAHMDRLYGVTMQERGVSRLLTVDLSHAMTMTDEVLNP